MPLLTLIAGSGLLQPSVIDTNTVLLFGVKVLFIVAGILYTLFAVLVTRQIAIMSKTITTTASVTIQLIGFTHLLISILVLIYFFIVL